MAVTATWIEIKLAVKLGLMKSIKPLTSRLVSKLRLEFHTTEVLMKISKIVVAKLAALLLLKCGSRPIRTSLDTL